MVIETKPMSCLKNGERQQAGHGRDLVGARAGVRGFGGRRFHQRVLGTRRGTPLLGERLSFGIAIHLGSALPMRGARHDRRTAVGICPLAHQLHAAHEEEQQQRHRQVDAEARQHGGDLVERQAGLGDDLVGDAAVDADRREAAALRTVHDHEPHEQRIDAVLGGKAERDRRDDGHRRRADRTHRREQRGDQEHDPRNGGNASAHGAHRQPDEPVDGAVVLRQRKQVGDAHQREKQVGGKAAHDRLRVHAGHQRADQEGADEGDHAHVDGQHRGQHEHADQCVDRNPM
jgi:hypothetical protein